MKQLAIRPRALIELEEVTEFYEGAQAGLGDRFADAIEAALLNIRSAPRSGSNRYVDLVPGLQMCVLRTFPYLIFYFEHADCVEVIRIIHGKRDLPAVLSE
jgi:toxin ParE1/3/4